MKFSHALVALVATIAQAQPIEDASPDASLDTSSAPHQYVSDWKRSLDKRADYSFTVWTGENCGGAATTISGPVGAKGNFSPKQKSVSLNSIVSGAHLSLYAEANQRPENSPNLRLTSLNIGECFVFGAGWGSYGVYKN